MLSNLCFGFALGQSGKVRARHGLQVVLFASIIIIMSKFGVIILL